MPTALERELAAIQHAHHRRLLATRQVAGVLIGRAWDTVAGVDDAALERFVANVVPIATATRAESARLAAGYLAANDAALGVSADIAPVIPILRGGAPVEDVYARGILEARRRLGDGAALVDAMAAGRNRAASTARTDVMLTNRAAIDLHAPARPWVVGYRRVLTGKSCPLCATASTQRYRSANLAGIHVNCDCDVAEIYGRADPGRVVNQNLLDNVKAAGEATGTPDYWNGPYMIDEDGTVRYRTSVAQTNPDGSPVRDANGHIKRTVVAGEPVVPRTAVHGELGAVLTDARHNFTGPDAIAAA